MVIVCRFSMSISVEKNRLAGSTWMASLSLMGNLSSSSSSAVSGMMDVQTKTAETKTIGSTKDGCGRERFWNLKGSCSTFEVANGPPRKPRRNFGGIGHLKCR